MVLDPAAFPVAFNRVPAFGIRRWRQAIEYRQFNSELSRRLDLAAHLVNDGTLQNCRAQHVVQYRNSEEVSNQGVGNDSVPDSFRVDDLATCNLRCR